MRQKPKLILLERTWTPEASEKWQTRQGRTNHPYRTACISSCYAVFWASVLLWILSKGGRGPISSWVGSYFCLALARRSSYLGQCHLSTYTRNCFISNRYTKYWWTMAQETTDWLEALWAIHQSQFLEAAQESVPISIPERWICSTHAIDHEIFQLWGTVLSSFCLSHQVTHAFHQGADDEHSVFYLSEHREDDHLYIA